MDHFPKPGGRTRREFLRDVIRFGVGTAAIAAFGPRAAPTVQAAGKAGEYVESLVADVIEATAGDFARGLARGGAVILAGGRAGVRGAAGGEFTSGIVALPFGATHLGLHWVVDGGLPGAVITAVRTSVDRREWSDLQRLSVEAVADVPEGQEVFAALAGAERARFAQYRLTFQTAQPLTVSAVTLTAINSVDGPRKPRPAPPPAPVTLTAPRGSQITVITREGWGCDESLRFRGSKEIWPEMYVPAKKIVIHHTATTNSYTDGAAEVRAVYTYHARTLRWGDIGYNTLVDKFGNIYEGRHGRGEKSDASREILSADVVAGHAYHHNYGSTGISAIGNYDTLDPIAAGLSKMMASLYAATAFECDRHGIDPYGTQDFLRSDDVWHPGFHNISGHYESYATECPGQYLRSLLDDDGFRNSVASLLADKYAAAPSLTADPSANQTYPAAGTTLEFTWEEGTVGAYCLEGWYKPASSEDITYLYGYEPWSGGDQPLAQVPVWTSVGTDDAGGKSYPNLTAGHYTMHVRGASTAPTYDGNVTYLLT